MEIKDLLEKITIDMVMEGCGLIGSFALLIGLFLDGGMGYLVELIGMTLCG